jgi:hypothetical protein
MLIAYHAYHMICWQPLLLCCELQDAEQQVINCASAADFRVLCTSADADACDDAQDCTAFATYFIIAWQLARTRLCHSPALIQELGAWCLA